MDETLVIHPGALGDVLLAVPALRALRRAHPDAELVLAAQSHIGELLTALGVVDRWCRFDVLRLEALFVDGGEVSPADALGHAVRVVCWFGANDSRFVQRLSTIVAGAIVASPTGQAGNASPTGNTGDVWRHLLATVGGVAAPDVTPIGVPAPLVEQGRRALSRAGWDGRAPLLIVHPGAGSVTKCWAAEGFVGAIAAVASRTPVTVVVHEGPADHVPAEALLGKLRVGTGSRRGGVGALAGPSLPVLAGALVHATAFIGNDSGISHLAAAVGTPSIVLFRADTSEADVRARTSESSSSSMLRWRPWARNVETIIVSTRSLGPDDETVVTGALERRFA